MADASRDRPAHPCSTIGIALTTVSAVLFLSLWALDAAGWIRNPYVGLLAFIAIPALFVSGLLLIPLGAWLSRRRARRGLKTQPDWPRVDLNVARTRRVVWWVLVATVVNLVIITAAGFQAVHYVDSPAFCGSVCHAPMQPQFVQWQAGPHAQIACVECHVGNERGSFIKAKIAGTRRLAHMISGTYPRPIVAAAATIPAAAFTCVQCHSTALFSGDKLAVIRTYADDEANSESKTTLRLHIGVGPSAAKDEGSIHWHAQPGRTIEYAATDAQENTIPWVRVTERDGRTRTFVIDGVNAATAPAAPRRMDCLACHNLPAHPFAASADRAVDAAIADGRLDRSLPYVRRETVKALTTAHATAGHVEDGVGRALRGFYGATYPALVSSRHDAVERAARSAQDLQRAYVFPSMQVTWGTYVSRIGHS